MTDAAPTLSPEPAEAPVPRRGYAVVLALVAGYIGIYLCRKNLSVAVPLLQDAWQASKQDLGVIASMSTAAYAAGKIVLGPVTDRIGGRAAFIGALALVALFGAAGAFMPGIAGLTLVYSLNRFAGAGAWPAMVKLTPGWFPASSHGRVAAVISLSYVLGGIAAVLFAREVLVFGGGWRAVMGVPSLLLAALIPVCALVVRVGPLAPAPGGPHAERPPFGKALVQLLERPQFLVTLALSFTLTLMRESFNTWSVDFLTSVQAGAKSVAAAALGSTTFDLAGAFSILAMGWVWDRTRPAHRRWVIAGVLAVLAAVLLVLPEAARVAPALGAVLIGAVGLLVYGPYSLLAGVLAIETGGPELAASAAGIIDFVGYVAGILAGVTLGRLLDIGGYPLGFRCLAGVTAVAAVLALALKQKS